MRRRSIAFALTVALLAPLAAGAAASPAVGPATLPMLALSSAARFPLDPPPAGQTPQERARWLVEERAALGATPAGWLRRARALAAARPVPAPEGDLVAQVLRLHRALGAAAVDAAALGLAAARVPEFARAPFAGLVSVVADAAEAQAPIARAVAARIARGMGAEQWLAPNERDAMTATRDRIVAAIDGFHLRTRDGFAALARAGARGILFADPLNLVVLGGTGDDTYERTPAPFPDPALLVDPAGSDTYRVAAGGACPWIDQLVSRATFSISCNNLLVAVHADLGDGTKTPSNDRYLFSATPSVAQGSGGFGAIGVLVDVAGDDEYQATMTRDAVPPLNSYVDAGAQGYGLAGVGLLVDRAGDDAYRFDVKSLAGHSIWAFAQGFGAGGGVGVLVDARGNDRWLAHGLGLVGEGFQGLYTTGVGFWAGVGVFADLGEGDDVYRGDVRAQNVDLYAYGFGALGGVGILYDDGGNDDYYSYEESTGPKPSWIDPLLNCAYGTGSLGGVGIMIDGGGDDVYHGETVSLKGGTVMDWGFGGPGQAYGLFADHGGDDVYAMYATGTKAMVSGRGHWDPHAGGEIGIGEERYGLGENTWGTFVDYGGEDTYVGGYGENDHVWVFGADLS